MGWRGQDAKGQEQQGAITLADLEMVEAAIVETTPVLVIIDPSQGYLGAKVDMRVFCLDVAERSECADQLAGGLLRDSETPPEIGGGRPVAADRLEDEAVQRSRVGMALSGELGVQVVDHRPEAPE